MIWLVGNKGMLGTELSGVFQQRGQAFTGSDREVDMLDPGALAAFAQGKGIRWIVNCAAYTAVDKAEDEEPLALRLNAEGPENLARLATTLGPPLGPDYFIFLLIMFFQAIPTGHTVRMTQWPQQEPMAGPRRKANSV